MIESMKIPLKDPDSDSWFSSQIICSKENRLWQDIPGIEISPNGRLWVCFFLNG